MYWAQYHENYRNPLTHASRARLILVSTVFFLKTLYLGKLSLGRPFIYKLVYTAIQAIVNSLFGRHPIKSLSLDGRG